ncbi:MAG: glycerol-3-phosphate acyltransferase [Chloroflexota bacterium]|nr:MAG: glycerol-3-phosphate acyltransferase [Chloroflexota bacterium]
MSNIFYLLLSAVIGYLFGAIPVGFLLVRIVKGIDLREFGSGRTGGTNSFRAGGVIVGVLTSILDVVKAACAVWIVRALFADQLPAAWLPWAEVASGIMSVIGHNWSIFLGFKGGAGTGPNVGWAGAIWLPIVPAAVIVVLGVLIFVGIASIASLAMSAVIPIAFALLYLAGVAPYDSTLAYMVGGIIAGAIIAWSLRTNIRRLLRGEERIVGPRAKRRQRKAEKAQKHSSDSAS